SRTKMHKKNNHPSHGHAGARGFKNLGVAEERESYRRELLDSFRYWVDSWRSVVSNKTLGQEFLAGITVAAVALPLNLALAAASGLPASAGLVAGAIGGIVAGSFGGAPLAVTGPAAALNVMVLAIVKDFG